MNKLFFFLCTTLILFHCSTMPMPGKDDKDAKKSSAQQTIKIEPGDGRPIVINIECENDNTNNHRCNNKVEPTIEIHNDGSNKTNVKTETNATNKNTNTNEVDLRINMRVKQLVKQITELSPHNMATSTSKWAKLHKLKIISGSLGATYLILFASLIAGNRFVNKRNTWASWKRPSSLEELQESSQDQLGRALIHDIQKRHVNKTNPTDHITPLVQFVQAVEKEMHYLNRYLRIAKTLKFCRLARIFPTNAKKIERALEARRRLAFVKHTFISWAATDNLANFNHTAPAA